MDLQTHALHFGPTGIASVRYLPTGELMHSHIGPWNEANLLYVDQGRVAARLRLPDPAPLVIYDLGLGIGANAIAAIECWKKVPGARKIEIISFENDLTGLTLALSELETFPFLKDYEVALGDLLSQGAHQSDCGRLSWTLRSEDFLTAVLSGPSPELIFFDFYSPKTSPSLWTFACFKKLYDCTSERRASKKSTQLLTYSAATGVRSALLLAGFQVGYGVSTPSKISTTVAATSIQEIEAPLDLRWFRKFESSTKPLPPDWELFRFYEAKEKLITSLGLVFLDPPEKEFHT